MHLITNIYHADWAALKTDTKPPQMGSNLQSQGRRKNIEQTILLGITLPPPKKKISSPLAINRISKNTKNTH